MTFILEQLTAALEHRRLQLEANQAEPNLDSENVDSPRRVPEDLIDPDLRDDVLFTNQPTSQRRHRSDEDDDTPDQRKVKFARITEDACNANNLRSTQRLEVQDFSALSLDGKLITVFAKLSSIGRDLAVREAQSYATKLDSKSQTQAMLHMLLYAPTTRSYVSPELKAFLRNDIVAHCRDWRILESTIQDPDALKKLMQAFGRQLTTIRNDAKDALNRARLENWCINRLLNKLAPDEMFITEAHRARWAWIFFYFEDYVKDSQNSPMAFWGKLDEALQENEKNLAREVLDVAERRVVRERLFTQALAQHRARYPSLVPPRDTPHDAPGWQISLELRIARKHSY